MERWTKNGIYYELVSFNSIMKIDRVKKLP